jgi:hypothetical protein
LLQGYTNATKTYYQGFETGKVMLCDDVEDGALPTAVDGLP